MTESNVWSWSSYPSIFALGHRYLTELLLDPVNVEEKIDGSQFSFGVFKTDDGRREIRCRSKGAQLNLLAPEQMFKKAIDTVDNLAGRLMEGWTYRAEYLQKPKHNTLVYDRVPTQHLILFDIASGLETYEPYDSKRREGDRLGLEVVPQLFYGKLERIELFRELLDTISILGGQKIEGVVIKNYHRFGMDKKILIGKFVSEAFKETHSKEWKASNPSQSDIIDKITSTLKTDARWHKAVQHLKEQGVLQHTPQDIGLLMKEIPHDIEKEEKDFILEKLYEWAWPQLRRKLVHGCPEWYKEQLLKDQFGVS